MRGSGQEGRGLVQIIKPSGTLKHRPTRKVAPMHLNLISRFARPALAVFATALLAACHIAPPRTDDPNEHFNRNTAASVDNAADHPPAEQEIAGRAEIESPALAEW